MTLKANFRAVQQSSGSGQGPEREAVSSSPSQENTMTDISTDAPITNRRLKLPRPSFPRLAIGASLNAICRLAGDAFSMAYVDPYTSHRRQPRIVSDDDLEGRDPNW
jgi:hypothetical protein